MTLKALADEITARGRGPLIAALMALLASLPTLFTLPPIDRDESRFAEASAQMLESGDFTTIMFQDQPRFKKPVGIYWLQALSVKLFSSSERREVWAYRIPSVLGAMLAAAACVWGAAAFLPAWAATLSGVLLASATVLATESTLAATDAALCGAVTLAMAALARIYLAAPGGPPASRWVKLLFWSGVSASVLLKGPIGPLVAALACAVLALWDRRTAWLKTLGWSWGLILFAAVTLPWAMAVTVATDGAFWGMAVGGDLAPKLLGGQEGHGAPPGYYALLSPLLLFPAALILPAALAAGWARRAEPGVRFAIAWLVPTWVLFELVPTKLPHYTLPVFGALAWLMAAALERPVGRLSRWGGAALLAVGAVGFGGFGLYAAYAYGDVASRSWALLAALFLAAAAIGGGVAMFKGRAATGAVLACALGVFGHDLILGVVGPSLQPLWLSHRVAQALAGAGISPRQGLAEAPVTVAGYGEPSIVFELGARTELADAAAAAQAIGEGRPAVVEGHEQRAFQSSLAGQDLAARLTGVVAGLDYSTGKRQILRIYAPVPDQPPPEP
ncbi:MAG: glycosyltransferase family 39 protein [Caulobacteraceae bacterium]|nr:glycosyltransferase family 39 protein [Caulobacteraceae bacterium]